MFKKALLAAALSAMVLGPANAADLCTDAHMAKMDQMIADMSDADKQKAATEALDKSKAAMKEGDTAGCMKYMNEAHQAMGL